MTAAQQSKAAALSVQSAQADSSALSVARAVIAARQAEGKMNAQISILASEHQGHVVDDVRTALASDGYELSAIIQTEQTFDFQAYWQNA